jgi:hypothetical protein
MAGWAELFYLKQDGIAITVKAHFDQVLMVSGAFTLAPVTLAGARPITYSPCFKGFFNALPVHPGHH